MMHDSSFPAWDIHFVVTQSISVSLLPNGKNQHKIGLREHNVIIISFGPTFDLCSAFSEVKKRRPTMSGNEIYATLMEADEKDRQ